MRILCCLDGTNVEKIGQSVERLLQRETRTIGILYVTDSEPELQMELNRNRFLRSPRHAPPGQTRMREAEERNVQEILNEGSQHLIGAEQQKRTGRPEREIVQFAEEWQADLLLICAHSQRRDRPGIGPKSVGHVARFVLDHAPCPVLLIRSSQPF